MAELQQDRLPPHAWPRHISRNADGSFSYTPAAGLTGTDSVIYHVSDGIDNSDAVLVSFSVSNAPPNATYDSYGVGVDTPLVTTAATGLLANDTDIDGDTLTASLVVAPIHGTLLLNADGSFSYTPAAGYTGFDTFTYAADDGADDGADSTTATVQLNVGTSASANLLASSGLVLPATGSASSAVPEAFPDLYTVSHGQTLSVSSGSGVLANDIDLDSPWLTASLVGTPVGNGTLTLSSDGAISYTPIDPTWTGNFTFQYQAHDGTNNSNIADVTIQVTNTAPVSSSAVFNVHQGTPLAVGAGNGLAFTTSDADADSLTVSEFGGPLAGLSLSADGSFNYIPTAGTVGTVSFSYLANDGVSNSVAAPVVINVTNNAPFINADLHYQTRHGQTLNAPAGALFATAGDLDSDTLTAQLPGGGTTVTTSGGQVTIDPQTGAFSFVPNANFSGSDSFQFSVSDGAQSSSTATVFIKVDNTTPEAYPSSHTLQHGTSFSGVLNVFDVEGDTLVVVSPSTPANGTLLFGTQAGNPLSFTYTPTAGPDFAGSDSFTVQVSDGIATSKTATVSFSVTNLAPLATNLNYQLRPGATITIPNILGEAWDGDRDTLSISSSSVTPTGGSTTAGGGTLELLANGWLQYTAGTSVVSDTYNYRVFDGAVDSEPATLTFSVQNETPVALPQTFIFHHTEIVAGAYSFNLLANTAAAADGDSDLLTAALASAAGPGSLTIAANGDAVFTPTSASFVGNATFQYRLNDSYIDSADAGITVIIDNEAPTAVNDSFTIGDLEALTITAADLLRNDLDIDGDAVTIDVDLTSFSGPGTNFGTLQTTSQAGEITSVIYSAPTVGFTGDVTFSYTLSDGAETSAAATATIHIQNSAPWSGAPWYQTHYNTPLSVSAADGLLAHAQDVDGDNLTVVELVPPATGTFAYDATTGSFTFTPAAPGVVTFTYKVSDGTAKTAEMTAIIDVTNTAPVAMDMEFSVAHNGTLEGTWDSTMTLFSGVGIFQMWDPDGDPLTFSTVGSLPAGLTVTPIVIDPNDPTPPPLPVPGDPNFPMATFSYLPPAGTSGPVSFQYQVNDGDQASNIATVTIHVTNRPPSALADVYAVHHTDTLTVGSVLANDWDYEGDALTATLVGTAPAGLTFNSDGTFTFDATVAGLGTHTFDYTVKDADPTGSTATVTVVVTNDPPVANDQAYYGLTAGQVLNSSVSMSDANGDPLTATLVGTAPTGLTFNANGTYSYTAPASTPFSESFTFQVTDGVATTATKTVTFTDAAAPPPPETEAFDDRVVYEWSSLMLATGTGTATSFWNFTDNDTIPIGEVVASVTILTQPANGTLTDNLDGTYSYQRTSNFTQTDSFTYQITTDITGQTSSATVSIDPLILGADESHDLWDEFGMSTGVFVQTGSAPSEIVAVGSATQVDLYAYSGDHFEISVGPGTGGSSVPGVAWHGAASGSLNLWSEGAILEPINISGDLLVGTGSSAGSIGNIADLSGRNVAVWQSGGNIGNVTATESVLAIIGGGGNVGHVTATNGDVRDVYAGSIASVSAAGGSIYRLWSEGNIGAITVGGDIGTVSAGGDITGNVTAGGSIGVIDAIPTEISYDPASFAYFLPSLFSGLSTYTGTGFAFNPHDASNLVGFGDASGLGGIFANGNITGSVTATGGNIGQVNGGISIDGGVTSSGLIERVIAGSGGIGGNVSAQGDLGAVSTSGSITGNISSTTGSIGSITAGLDITGDIGADGSIISTLDVGRHLTGSVTATTGNIAAIAVGTKYATGGDIGAGTNTISAGGKIGSITATATSTDGGNITLSSITATSIDSISAGSGINTAITVGTYLGPVTAGTARDGDVEGSILAGAIIKSVDVQGGSLDATVIVTAAKIGDLSARDNISGSISGPSVGNITTTTGDISGGVSGTNRVGNVSAGKDIPQPISSSLGSIGTVTAGTDKAGNIWGDITAPNGSIVGVAAVVVDKTLLTKPATPASTFQKDLAAWLNSDDHDPTNFPNRTVWLHHPRQIPAIFPVRSALLVQSVMSSAAEI